MINKPLRCEDRSWPRYWYSDSRRHFIVRWASTGLWYVNDRWSYESWSGAKQRLLKENGSSGALIAKEDEE